MMMPLKNLKKYMRSIQNMLEKITNEVIETLNNKIRLIREQHLGI